MPTDALDVEVTREHAKGDCAIRGSASQLLLGMWRRIPMSSLEVIGSTEVASGVKDALLKLFTAGHAHLVSR